MTALLVPQTMMETFCDPMDTSSLSLYPGGFETFIQKREHDNSYDPVSGATYTDLSLPKPPLKRIKKEVLESNSNLSSWKHTHPENWSNKEVLDWVYFIADDPKYCFDCEKFKGEVFQNLSGRDLCRMSRDDFLERDSEHGEIFYELLKSLLEGVVLSEPAEPTAEPTLTEAWTSLESEIYADCCNSGVAHHQIQHKMECKEEQYSPGVAQIPPADYAWKVEENSIIVSVDEGETWYDIDMTIPPFELTVTDRDYSSGYSSGGSESGNESPATVPDASLRDSLSPDLACFPNEENTQQNEPITWKSSTKRRKSPHTSSYGDLETREEKRRGRRIGQPSKCNHLWEFIRDLLKDPETMPSLLRWEDRDNGVFKFMQSEQVAKLWGKKKNNPHMTYEKLSRAMRFCRSAGYFAEVPKNGKFPKKLCFKFGPKAYGWQPEKDDITTHKGSWKE